MIINFAEKYTYNYFYQVKNHLIIETVNGVVDIVFTSEVPVLEFMEYEKNQLILKVK